MKQQLLQNKDEIIELQTKIFDLEIKAKENRAKAETIENAIYDIKAVNPNAKDTTDKRTPSELLEFIGGKSNEVQRALDRLKTIF